MFTEEDTGTNAHRVGGPLFEVGLLFYIVSLRSSILDKGGDKVSGYKGCLVVFVLKISKAL